MISFLKIHQLWNARPSSLAALAHVALRHRFRLDIRRKRSVVRGMRKVSKIAIQPVSAPEIAYEIKRLSALSLKDLRVAWAAEFGREPPESLWRDLLLRTLAWRLQERALGGHDKGTLKLLEASGPRMGDTRCQRLKSGTVLVRDFGGTRHTVSIVPDGFVWQDKTYSSLSAIARLITGTSWNGPRFFGLRDSRGGRNSKQREEAA